MTTYLLASDAWWQHQALVVAVHHAHDANGACRDPPRVLEHILLLARLRILKYDLEHLGEVLTQVVGCRTLCEVTDVECYQYKLFHNNTNLYTDAYTNNIEV